MIEFRKDPTHEPFEELDSTVVFSNIEGLTKLLTERQRVIADLQYQIVNEEGLFLDVLNSERKNDFAKLLERLKETLRIPRIAILGSQGSGKTTLIEKFRDEISCVYVSEIATTIKSNTGYRPNASSNAEQLRKYQTILYKIYLNYVELAELKAETENCVALVCDRGTLDGAAYLKGGLQEFEKICETTRDTEYSRYDLVVFLDPPHQKSIFDEDSELKKRNSSYERSLSMSKILFELWKDFPYFYHVKSEPDFNRKLCNGYMAMTLFISVTAKFFLLNRSK